MPRPHTNLQDCPAWSALTEHQAEIGKVSMRSLFESNPQRYPEFTLSAAGFMLDYSKNRITPTTMHLLQQLAEECDLKKAIEAMFTGVPINHTEGRPVLHTALRDAEGEPVMVKGQDVKPEIRHTLDRMEKFVWRIHSGQHRGFTHEHFTDVVSIGIGGSYLGPKVVSEALTPYHTGELRVHYVANIDGTDISEKLRPLDPARTLFLIQSKSFGTQETLENSKVARAWFLENGGTEADIARHFVAISSNVPAAMAFGIEPDNIFPMWDWVGGRYSLWSAIGLPVILAIGMDNFRALLRGAREMDLHFRHAPLAQNIPVILGLLGIWYNNFMDAHSCAIIPYDHYLRALPAHLQQLDMESNGKSVDRSGWATPYETGPIIWGGAGANGQHAYHQLIHQGTKLIPVDFIIPLKSQNPIGRHHPILFANCLAQSQAMMQGKTLEEAKAELLAKNVPEAEAEQLAPHKVIQGNKPNNLIVFEKATPETIGGLIALYEHKVFVQGAIWNLNSFDQWGVELGKQLGNLILPLLEDPTSDLSRVDASTSGLIKLYHQAHQE